MLALGFHQHGNSDVMQLYKTEIPVINESEVLIDVKASAFNHLDIWVREGWPGLNLALPHISGSDVSGVVMAVGKNIKNLSVGDRVAVNPGINLQEDEFTFKGEQSESPHYIILGEHVAGTHAEFVKVPGHNCIKLPDHISYATAAACSLVGITAWRMLIERAKLTCGEKILIIGAGGGVNSMAIQIAKLAGADVFAVTSTEEKMQKAKTLGADVVLNYQADSSWAKKLMKLVQNQGFDVVVDNVGAATLNTSMKLVKRGGRIIIVGNTSGPKIEIDIRFIFSKQISLIGSTMGNQFDFQQVINAVFQGRLQPEIHCKIPLKQGLDAMKIIETGSQFGKVILTQE